MSRPTGLILMLAGLAACVIGPRGEEAPLARQPRGAEVTLQTQAGAIRGELLAVQDTALVVLTGARRVSVVPFRLIREGEAELAGRLPRGGRVPHAEQLERLRLVSRFPQGLDLELQRSLLQAYGQTEPGTIRP